MTTYTVEFKVDIPGDVPEDELAAFISFELGERGHVYISAHALASKDLRSFEVRDVRVRPA